MPTDELGRGMDDDIGAMLERLHQVRRGQRVVEDERQSIFMRDIGDRPNVQRIQARIADGFREDGFGALVDGGAQVLRVAAVEEAGRDAELGQRVVEQVIRAAIQAGRGGDFISRVGDIENCQRLGRLPRRGCQRAHAALERGHTALKGILRRVHDARIDIAELAQAEEVCRVFRAIEDIRRRLVDRHGARIGRAVRRLLARVQ